MKIIPPVVAAVEDVVAHSANGSSSGARHGREHAQQQGKVNNEDGWPLFRSVLFLRSRSEEWELGWRRSRIVGMSVLSGLQVRRRRRMLILAAGGVIVALWVGLWLRILGLPPREAVNLGRRIWPAVAAQHGNRIAFAEYDRTGEPGVPVWDVAERKLLVTVPRSSASDAQAWPAAFSRDSTLLATMESRNGNFGVRIWDLATTRLLMEVWHDRYPEVAFSPDKSAVAMLRCEVSPNAASGHVIRIWDLSTQQDRVIATATVGVRSLVYSSDGRQLAAGYFGDSNRPGAIRLWDVATGQE